MASNIRKAGSALRKSFRHRRYLSLELDETIYTESSPQRGNYRKTNEDSKCRSSTSSSPISASQNNPNETLSNRTTIKRGASMTQSMREAVGTIRQKFRMSTRRLTRLQSQTPPGRAGKRRHTLNGKDVKMFSPFGIETPKRTDGSGPKSCLSTETPTRLRREVEALTSNMQALSALTPNTLHARARARRDPPLTNGSLKTPRANRRRITTEIY
ncbi:hypothetical protein RRG08_024292 [Elysia crispata]|uniref:Uncharacterized protein n=1 Tax=Elysia crispata TaxID=231223 RepID=A0AAE0ZLZ4_9GAST|nr:hypothetical protein RRG08_024292 [Elysia crispata]